MDHSLYPYSALPTRPGYRWPGDRGLAAYAVLFLEHWEFLPEPGALRDPRMVGEFGSFTPDYRSWSQREYGLRIGIFRVIDELKQAGITPVIAANAMAVRRLPRLVDSFNQWGCDWLAHGVAATRMLHAGMPLDAQREHVADSIAAIAAATGRRPTGWVSQDWGTTPDTHALLAEAGITHTLDWSNDDQPYPLHAATPLWSVPLSSEWDDVQCQWLRNIEPRAHAELAAAAFARLHAECEQQHRAAVFGVSIHPWLSGMPSRIQALRTLLAQLKAQPGVWWTTPAEIVRHTPR
ncbi:MAG: polysaccharide deacetylase [Rhodoferax sp.]|nr:polysaccharide deacetylase [Rhodoferax sp.]